MNQPNYNQGLPANPIVQIIGFVIAVLVAIGAVFLGAVVLSFFIGFAIIGWIILSIRVWWLRRQMYPRSRTNHGSRPGEIVEVEYSVVKERAMNQRKDGDSD